MKFLRIFLCVAFIFAIAACHGKKGNIYDYPDEDTTPEKGDVGDPCIKNGDCKEGLLCISKVCSEPASDEDQKDDADTETEDSDTDTDTNDDDTDTGMNDDDTDTDTNDDDEPDDTDTQPDDDSDTTPYNPECGNGVVEMGEECDDGFANSDESGTYDVTCRTNCRFARCGDSITDSSEACDDGNRMNGDYCSADCTEIIGWCGDGKKQNNEECDPVEDPYCSDDCSEITGSCGDGIKQANEQCDKAEPSEGGGHGVGPHYCSADCSTLIGWCGDGERQAEVEECDDGADNGKYGKCNTTCTDTTRCGDGIVQPAYEKCDDGNNENGDYCSSDCQNSYGSCGDGIIQSFETCDPNKTGDPNSPYCSDDCKQINGWCGDEEINGNETCDEGEGKNGVMIYCSYGSLIGCEVCSSNCQKIPGTLRYCGDGVISNSEVCDPNKADDPNSQYCSSDCKKIEGYCGDGVISHGEVCDPNKADDPNSQYCSSDCKNLTGSCGDGQKNGNEECDKGTNNGKTDCDYSLTTCKVCTTECKEIDGTPHYCGDQQKDETNGEKCDDGNGTDGLNGTYGHCKADCSGIGEHCGDGIKQEAYEDCDLGDGVNGTITDCAYGEQTCKVCTSDCHEVDGNTSFCGDKKIDTASGEKCDDGNTADGDYCSADCKTVTGECGDGIKQENEACDDGNTVDGDYCSADCQTVTGECGDGIQQANETCDDGANNGKYKLNYPPNCNSNCNGYSGYCNDGNIDSDGGEQCDEGSNNGKLDCEYGEISCFVCNSNCQIRNGETSYCGDTITDTANGEACDDGNTVDGDYCSSDCHTVTGECGDSIKQDNEACDDGNNDNNDYCSYDCQTVTGYCGDGTRQLNEVCDNADPSIGAGEGTGAYCSFNCQESYGSCGDGIKQDNETCDDGNTADGDYCSADCQTETGSCGDGIKQDNETCDDGNTADGDYCSADCQTETGECGDGIKQDNETCDDGSDNGTYNHCNNNCNGYMARCGDGNIDTTEGEFCDEGDGINGTYNHCSGDCAYIMECGDGVRQSAYEACDNGPLNGTYNYCNEYCTKKTGWCNDGLWQNEDCNGAEGCHELSGGDEECDNGYLNGLTECDYGEKNCKLCTTECKKIDGNTSYCGDKEIDSYNGEICDDGSENGNFGKCDKTCHEIVTWECGDGNIDWDHDETCDDGTDNGTPYHCNSTCNGPTPYCGDGKTQREECSSQLLCDKDVTEYCCEVVDGMNEVCDDFFMNGAPGYCYTDCSGYCGDGILQKHDCDGYGANCVVSTDVDETCDEGYGVNGTPGHCNNTCDGSTPVCGNGTIEAGEACDEGDDNGKYYGHCNANCSSTTWNGYCGDNIIQIADAADCPVSFTLCDGNTTENCCEVVEFATGDSPETCDEGDKNDYHGHCNKYCNGTASCGNGDVGKDEICEKEGSLIKPGDDPLECSIFPQFKSGTFSECDTNCMPILTDCVNADSYTSPFFKTGQTLCYSATGITACHESALPFYGQEAEFEYTAHDFDEIAEGKIIKDNASGLMWETETPDNYGVEKEGVIAYYYCEAETSCTKEEAEIYCSNLAIDDYYQWRLPTAAEFSTIMDYASTTHIYSGFGDTTHGPYWTSDGVIFSTANGTYSTPTLPVTAQVKCVHSINDLSGCTSVQCLDKPTLLLDFPDSIITIYKDAVYNFWYFGNTKSSVTWEAALAFCNNADNLNGVNKMRLPTVNELMSLIDRENGGSLIREFTDKAWTSTTWVNGADVTNAYIVDFSDGSVSTDTKTNTNIVICVE